MSENKHIDIEIDDKPDDTIDDKEWDTCCSHSSKEFIKYMVTVSISLIVLIFCLFMITINPDEDNSIYFSLMSSIITLYVPSPQINKKYNVN